LSSEGKKRQACQFPSKESSDLAWCLLRWLHRMILHEVGLPVLGPLNWRKRVWVACEEGKGNKYLY